MKNHQGLKAFFASEKGKKIFALFVIGIILLTLPVLLWQEKQRQVINQNAYTGNVSKQICGKVQVDIVENPSCPRLSASSDGNNTCTITDKSVKNQVSTYSVTLTVTSLDKASHAVAYQTFSNFCTGGYGDLSANAQDCHCNDAQQTQSQTLTVDSSGPQTIPITRSSPNGTACGTYQFDFVVNSVDGNTSCNYGKDEAHPGTVGHCETGTDCTATTPTPTPSPTTPPSPTDTPVPTTPSSPTNTPIPGITVTDTPTIPPTITPVPTLPPTGPGNTILGVGIIGAIITVAGVALAVGL